jgi:hypothetical protein
MLQEASNFPIIWDFSRVPTSTIFIIPDYQLFEESSLKMFIINRNSR